jgi:proliferating cell nuclear antigen PCNA
MFNALLENISLFRDSIATIAELIDETEIKIRKDGVKLIASDRAVVSVVDFFFSSENFKEYHYESDVTIGINLQSLLQILKRAKSKDTLALRLEEGQLTLVLKGDSIRRFKIPLIDIREEVPPGIEKLTFPAKVEIRSDILSDGISDAELIGDSVVFEVNTEKFVVKAEGDSSSVELELTKDSDAIKITTSKEARARYSIEYLKKMIKGEKISEVATLEFDNNYPLRLTFSVQDKVRLSFILAPRVED